MQKEKKILLIAIILGIGLFGALVHFYGYRNTWHLWHIPTDNSPSSNSPFLDLRLITGSAESYAAGFDPTINNPFDPTQRIFNYPKIWYLILASGINQNWTVPIALVMIGLVLLSVVLFPGKLTWFSTLLLVFALFSPAAMLEFERANVDGFFFVMMTAGLLLLDVSAIASFIIFLISILFKIFPVFGLAYFLDREKKASIKYPLFSILFTGLYFVATLKEMLFILHYTQKGYDQSYGVSVLPALLFKLVGLSRVENRAPLFYHAIHAMYTVVVRLPNITYLIAIAIIIVFSLLGFMYRKEFKDSDIRNLRAFWIGAGIYIGTFLLGNNWDYRLIFLLFTLPQLGDWAMAKNRITANIARVTLVLLFLSCWYLVINAMMARSMLFGTYVSDLLDEAINWSLFAGLIYLFAFSMPGWFVDTGRLVWSNLLHIRDSRSTEHEIEDVSSSAK